MIHFELITPERKVFSEDVYEVILPTSQGQISVFPHHLPVATILTPGVLALRKTEKTPDSELEHVAISGGYVQIDGIQVRVLADTAERADEISQLRAQEAKKRAQMLLETTKDEIESAQASAALERAITRIKVAGLKKRRSHHGPTVE
ncbi:ATP synthase F1 subunit epsilon [Candidatus Berkelbacteria bacterium]|nr:ATP synthase F1 subunit epsilon [Candidatus Berkelbacteria bacterium]